MAKKYVLEISALQVADVVLTGLKSFSGNVIRASTISRYSHAAIYVGGTMIEATLEGVFSMSPQRIMFDRFDDVAVLRSKIPLTVEAARRVCDFAQTKVGSLYALDEAIFVRPRSLLRIANSKKQFCSRLVAQAYREIGFDLKNLKYPDYCTPGQLSRCKAFTHVEHVVREANRTEIEFAKSPDPNKEHQRQTFEWLNRVRASVKADARCTGADVQTIGDVGEFLQRHPEFDDEFSGYLKTSGYLTFWELDSMLNPYRYDPELFLQRLMKYLPQSEEIIASELGKEGLLLRRFCIGFDDYYHQARHHDLQFFRLQLVLYFKLVEVTSRRLSVIRTALQKMGREELFEDLAVLAQGAEEAVEKGRAALATLKPAA